MSNPVDSFLEGSFPQYVLDALDAAGITEPQFSCSRPDRHGRRLRRPGGDRLGQTLAYLLPALVHVNGSRRLTTATARSRWCSCRPASWRSDSRGRVSSPPLWGSHGGGHGGVPKGPVMALKKAPRSSSPPGRLRDLSTRQDRDVALHLPRDDEADRMPTCRAAGELRSVS